MSGLAVPTYVGGSGVRASYDDGPHILALFPPRNPDDTLNVVRGDLIIVTVVAVMADVLAVFAPLGFLQHPPDDPRGTLMHRLADGSEGWPLDVRVGPGTWYAHLAVFRPSTIPAGRFDRYPVATPWKPEASS